MKLLIFFWSGKNNTVKCPYSRKNGIYYFSATKYQYSATSWWGKSLSYNVFLLAHNSSTFCCHCLTQDDSRFSAPDVIPPENHNDSLTHHTSRFGTVIPNRIFVGGIDYKVRAADVAPAVFMFELVVDTREQQSM